MRRSGPFSYPAIQACLLRLAIARGENRSFFPAEAARILGHDWRALMPTVRRAGARLVHAGLLRCTLHGTDVNPLTCHGPIRFVLAGRWFDQE